MMFHITEKSKVYLASGIKQCFDLLPVFPLFSESLYNFWKLIFFTEQHNKHKTSSHLFPGASAV
jgi:hypothetical protein